MKIDLFMSGLKDDLQMCAHFAIGCELFVKFLEGSVKFIYYREKEVSSAKGLILILTFQAGHLCKREKIRFSNQFDDYSLSTTRCLLVRKLSLHFDAEPNISTDLSL